MVCCCCSAAAAADAAAAAAAIFSICVVCCMLCVVIFSFFSSHFGYHSDSSWFRSSVCDLHWRIEDRFGIMYRFFIFVSTVIRFNT